MATLSFIYTNVNALRTWPSYVGSYDRLNTMWLTSPVHPYIIFTRPPMRHCHPFTHCLSSPVHLCVIFTHPPMLPCHPFTHASHSSIHPCVILTHSPMRFIHPFTHASYSPIYTCVIFKFRSVGIAVTFFTWSLFVYLRKVQFSSIHATTYFFSV